MTCRRFKKEILMEIYGELRDKKRRSLDAHLSHCPSCREELEMTREVLDSLDRTRPEAVPEADWERSWRAVETGLGPSRRAPRFLASVPRWAYASLAVAALFVLGLAVGRYWWPSRPVGPITARTETLSAAAVQTLLARYREDITPVLLDYANDGSGQDRRSDLLSDRRIAASLLVQNMLLKRALAQKDPALAELFDDLGMILTEISNLKNQDTATPASLRDVINQRQVLPRIRRLERT